MAPPEQVVEWVRRTYPKPSVDPEWLEGCYSWIESSLNLDPVNDLETILYNVETQLLQSDLCDSMLAGTGLPVDVSEYDKARLTGPPILVEIVSITEIGHSAFSLLNVRQARSERADLTGLAEEEENDEEAGPVPNYPRSMLQFELSDGSTTMKAIEYRSLPDLELGDTALGFKMLLKNVFIRRGIAWLEPHNVVLKGYQTEDRQANQDADFVRDLRQRLGLEDEPANEAPAPAGRDNSPAPQRLAPPRQAIRAPPQVQRTPSPPMLAQQPPLRSPLQDLDDFPEPPEAGPSYSRHDDDAEQPRRRKLPAEHKSTTPDVYNAPLQRPVASQYFPREAARKVENREEELSREFRLSPHRRGPIKADESNDENGRSPRKAPTFRGSTASHVSVRLDPDVVAAGNGKVDNSPKSSEFEFDLDIDDDVLATLDRVEKQALASTSAGAGPSSRAASVPASAPSSTLVAPSTRASTVVATQRTTVARPVQRRRQTPSQTQRSEATVHLGTITVESSSEDEKENVPAPTRHVRRRIAPSQVAPEDIIEISD